VSKVFYTPRNARRALVKVADAPDAAIVRARFTMAATTLLYIL